VLELELLVGLVLLLVLGTVLDGFEVEFCVPAAGLWSVLCGWAAAGF
jgi:hypothetical protein